MPSTNTNSPKSARSDDRDVAGEAQLDEFDLAADRQGDNSLAGDDQLSVPNQRYAQADGTGKADELIESFRKLDPRYRAEAERQQGQRSGGKDR